MRRYMAAASASLPAWIKPAHAADKELFPCTALGAAAGGPADGTHGHICITHVSSVT